MYREDFNIFILLFFFFDGKYLLFLCVFYKIVYGFNEVSFAFWKNGFKIMYIL